MTHTLISVPFEKTCYHGGDLPATWQKWCSLLHYCLLVTPCSLVDKHQTSTETFASISASDRGSRLNCNGASLPDYTALQLATQWLSSSSSSVWTHWGPKRHHLEHHFDTDACEQIIFNGKAIPIFHTTACAVSNTTHWYENTLCKVQLSTCFINLHILTVQTVYNYTHYHSTIS